MTTFSRIIGWEPLNRVRRNHALEHATLQILSQQDPRRRMAGYSDTGGFWVVGELSIEEIQQAVDEALTRLRAGESRLAVHPFCGTNFVASGLVAGSLAWLGMLGTGRSTRDKLDRLPVVISLVVLGMIFSQPLGPFLQARVTTDANMGDMQVTGITRYKRKDMPLHRVSTRF